MIPQLITRDHILKAVARIRQDGVPRNRISRRYCLVHDGRRFPPKYTISVAHEVATGRPLPPDEFSGGAESNRFLGNRGFKVIRCDLGDSSSNVAVTSVSASPKARKCLDGPRPTKSKSRDGQNPSTRHSQSCAECKVRIQELLERIYGKCLRNQSFGWKTDLAAYEGTPIYSTLRDIVQALETNRGFEFKRFAKSRKLAPCDYWVPDPGFILEFDERQHFTGPRRRALSSYPDDQPLGFSRERWMNLCEQHDAKDNHPVYRDEQRAWYDALRDLVPSVEGLQPTVRLYAGDSSWCLLDPDSAEDRQRFLELTQGACSTPAPVILQGTDASAPTPSALRVALVFPEIDGQKRDPVPTRDWFAGETVDFVLFPETYINLDRQDIDRIGSLKRLACELNVPLLVGVRDSRRETIRRLDPDGSDARLYTKHSTAGKVAFAMQDWRASDRLRTFELCGVTAGATICHDHYLGLLPRYLAKSGASLWVNPSYDNVVDLKWSSVLRLRAVENRFFALCTLNDDVKKRSRTHPFGFSPEGREIWARRAGSTHKKRLSECTKPRSVYIADLDIEMVGGPVPWDRIPRADNLPRPKPRRDQKDKPRKPVRIALRENQPAVFGYRDWQTQTELGRSVETRCGSVYVGMVPAERILDAASCFRVIDRARQKRCAPIIWNHWDSLPTDSARLATLMLGRAIECCAPIVISDRHRIHELVELGNNNKFPVRRTIDESGEAIVDIGYAWSLNSAFKPVIKCLEKDMRQVALDRYRSLANSRDGTRRE